MNKVYKSVWNASAGTYVAAAETTKSSGKKSNRAARNIASAAVASVVALGSVNVVYAADASAAPRASGNLGATATPAPSKDWFFCFLFWCGGDGGDGGGGNTTNVTYNGVNAEDAYAYTYNRNDLKYFHVASALGDSSASGGDAIAIGGAARANSVSKDGSTYGSPGSTSGNGPVAIGAQSVAQGAANVALGVDAQADGLYHAVALGGNAQAAGAYTTSVGGHSMATANSSSAFGSHASALASGSVALGYDSIATRANTVSVGRAGAERQLVNVAAGSAGTDAVNLDQLNAAISAAGGGGGVNPPPPPDHTDLKYFHAKSVLADSVAGGVESVAMGGNAAALGANSVALGSNSRAERANTVSIGSTGAERQLINLAAGTTDTDAVNVKQLNTTVRNAITGGVGDLVVYDSSAHDKLTLGGVSAAHPATLTNVAGGALTQNSTDAVNGGQLFALATATNQGFQQVGNGVAALAQSTAAALGGNASANTPDGSISAPSYTVAGTTYHNVGDALGALAVNGGSAPDAVRYDTSAHNKVTLGGSSATSPVALANVAAGSADTDAVNLKQLRDMGGNIDSSGHLKNSFVAYDDSTQGTISLKGASGTKITKVAAGTVSASSSDAINGAQLYQTASSVAGALGGASAVGADGRVSATYTLDGATYNNVGAALAAVNAKTGSGSANGVTYDTPAHDIVTFGGTSAHAPVTLSNLAAGEISASSKDAITGAQLYASANSMAAGLGGGTRVNGDGTLSAPTYTIAGVTYSDIGSAMNAIGSVGQDVQVTAKYVKVVSSASEAISAGSETTAIGGGSYAAGNKSLAIGTGARAQFDNSVALGSGSQVYEQNTLSVGHTGAERRITNVANGIAATDAATVGQLNSLQQQLTKQSSGVRSMALLGATPVTDYIAVSPNTTAGAPTHASNDNNAMAVGPTAMASGINALAVGAGAGAARIGSTAVGSGAAALALNATVIGVGASTGFDAKNGVAIGYMSDSEAEDALGFGTFSIANGKGSVAMGTNALTNTAATNGVAIGASSTVSAAGSVALGANSVADRANSVSVGSGAQQRQVVNVAAGTANTDAVNVSQLKGVTTALGGGAGVNPDGTLKSPTYTIGSQTYTDVGNALAAAAASSAGAADAVKYDTSAHTRVTLGGLGATTPVALSNVAAGVANTDAVNVKQLKDMGASIDTGGNVSNAFVAYDDTTRSAITLKGAAGTKITKLAAGDLSATSSDAVNGAQLYQTNQNVANVAGSVSNLAGNVTNVTNVVNNITNGQGIKYFHANSTLADSSASGTNAVAIGGNARATAAGAVALGANSLADRANTVSVGASGAERQLINVAAGSANTDAVNLKQLKDMGASIDSSGNVSNAFVAYDSSAKTRVTLGGLGATAPVALSNVAAGVANTDAVNVKQLKDMGASIDTGGNVSNAFVAYDDTTRGAITLKGAAGTKITKLAAGDLSATSSDAVNGAQLYQTNQNVANVAGNVTNLTNVVNNITGGGSGLKYFHVNSTLADSSASGTNAVAIGGNARATATGAVALGANSLADRANTVSVGASGAERQLTNVAAGSANTDAVNLKQLKDMGASIDSSGNVSNAFVAYDSSAKTRVTLGGLGATTPVALSNVAAGVANTDAVNVKQLKDMGASIDTGGNVSNAFVAYDDTTRGAITLKGAAGTKITKLAAGDLSATSSDAVNGAQLYQTNQNVANVAGSVTNVTNVVNNITNGQGIKYFHANSTLSDATATGSDAIAIGGNAKASAANSVALGANATTTTNLTAAAYQPGTLSLAGTAPIGEVSVGSAGQERRLTNVAAGAANTDAVNVSQLKSAVAASSAASVATAVQYDTSSRDNVTLGGIGTLTPVGLHNVAPGQLVVGGKDAVNGGQLFNTASSTAAALGGGASMGADGKLVAPTYHVNGSSYGNVGDALNAMSDTVNTINTDVTTAQRFIKVASHYPDTPEALASGANAVAIGGGANATNSKGVAIGSGSRALADGATAFGGGAIAQFENSTAIGSGARTYENNVVSVGAVGAERRITNVANGIAATDVATVGQLNTLQQQLSKQSSGVKSMLLGATPVTDYIAVSPNTTAGAPTHASNDTNAMAVGPTSMASGINALAVGAGAGAARIGSTAVGSGTAALGLKATVIGYSASTGFDAENGVAIGYMADAEGVDAQGIGTFSLANGSGSIAIGSHSLTTNAASDSVALGSNSVADRANTISVGSNALQRQIVNVAAGSANTDAVNVSQLKGVTTALGGGAQVNGDGTLKNPTYKIGNTTYTDVGSALAAAASASGGTASPDAVMYDTSAHARVTLGGGAGAPVTLTNLAAGLVSSSSRDAMNGSQLYGTANSLAKALGGSASVGADGKVANPTYSIGGQTYSNVGAALAAVDSTVTTGDPNGVVYDSSARDRLTLGGVGAGSPVTLTNLADAKGDSDAVNLRQLKAAGLNVDPSTGIVTNSFVAYDNSSKSSVTFNAGGSSTQLKNIADGVDQFDAVNLSQMERYVAAQINSTPVPMPIPTPDSGVINAGTASGDAIAIGNGSVASGAAAIAIGARTVTAGDGSVALGAGSSAPAANAVALGANSIADRDNTVSMGAAGAERQITNVAAGSAPTDAVNVSQLSGAVNGLQRNIQDMDRDNRRGIASASALNIVTPYLPGRTTLNAGVAGYRGTAALGLGVSRWNEKGTVNYNLGVSSAGGNSTIVRAGVGIVFGN